MIMAGNPKQGNQCQDRKRNSAMSERKTSLTGRNSRFQYDFHRSNGKSIDKERTGYSARDIGGIKLVELAQESERY